jgi:type II secretory pathway pseudopilin PulG
MPCPDNAVRQKNYDLQSKVCFGLFILLGIAAVVGFFYWMAKSDKDIMLKQQAYATGVAHELQELPREQWAPILEQKESPELIIQTLGDGYILTNYYTRQFSSNLNGKNYTRVWFITIHGKNKVEVSGPFVDEKFAPDNRLEK